MPEDTRVRWGWLRAMYILTIVGAGSVGLGIIIIPDLMRSTYGWPIQDPVVFGICGSVYVAFALLSILGLKSPLKFVSLLLLQLTYKVLWFVGVILRLLLEGKFPSYAVLHVAIFAIYVIGDLIAIPFPYVFRKEGAARLF